jgi:hypothetical protein
VYDVEGPRVRLGILWCATNAFALGLGLAAVALVYAAVSGVAALQTARAWERAGERPHRLAAGAVAAALPLAAAVHTAALGAALIVGVAACLWACSKQHPGSPVLRDAGFTLQSSLFAGMAAASVVLTYRYEPWATVALIAVVLAYEAGDFVVGSGAANHLEGPTAGIAGLVVVMVFVGLFEVPPLDGSTAWRFGLMAALLAPLGQLGASLVLPAPDAEAPALRRLDSLLLLAPVWAFAAGLLAA